MQYWIKHNFLFVLLVLIIYPYHLNAQSTDKNDESMDKMWGSTKVSSDKMLSERSKLFDESNYGMFIHWGLYSSLSGKWKNKTYYGIGEWIMNPRVANIPPKEYMSIAKNFNPSNFDAKAIAQLAKDAGMKYIIITSKHHEGFAMFDSKVSDFNIVDATPFARDPMKELSAACHELGLGFGFYYSHYQDWTAPGGHGGPTINDDGTKATFEDYFYNKCKPQVKEICSNYGKIDFVWFDTPGDMPKKYVIELVDLVRKLQPNAMLCSRVGYGLGDYASKGDMEVPSLKMNGLWETCDTHNDSWSYAWYDNNYKSPKEILHRLISTVARGGTYLLNVGPDAQGVVPALSIKYLTEAGKWIQKQPQVIYKAGPSPWNYGLPWGDVTTQGQSMYLSVFDWPEDNKIYLPGLQSTILSAKILNGKEGETLDFKQDKDWPYIIVSERPIGEPITVIEVTMKMNSETIAADTTMNGVFPNIETPLMAELAEVKNAKLESVRWMEKFGEWKHAYHVSNWGTNGQAQWTVNVQSAGYYYIKLQYKGEGRLVWETETDEGIMIQNQQAATEKYQSYPMGILEFKEAGKHTISVSLIEGDPSTSCLKTVILQKIN